MEFKLPLGKKCEFEVNSKEMEACLGENVFLESTASKKIVVKNLK